jgi:hypothetical protein
MRSSSRPVNHGNGNKRPTEARSTSTGGSELEKTEVVRQRTNNIGVAEDVCSENVMHVVILSHKRHWQAHFRALDGFALTRIKLQPGSRITSTLGHFLDACQT